jgi:hypothetical protein
LNHEERDIEKRRKVRRKGRRKVAIIFERKREREKERRRNEGRYNNNNNNNNNLFFHQSSRYIKVWLKLHEYIFNSAQLFRILSLCWRRVGLVSFCQLSGR